MTVWIDPHCGCRRSPDVPRKTECPAHPRMRWDERVRFRFWLAVERNRFMDRYHGWRYRRTHGFNADRSAARKALARRRG